MIKNVSVVFVVWATLSLLLFSFVGKDTPTEGLTLGDKAPEFKICGERELVELSDFKGKYVLLSFWASYDAPSRVKNATLSHVINKNNQVEMVSVSFDHYKSIFNETVRKDQILISNCFVETDGEKSELYQTYRLNKGFKNYLLDRNGVIIAKDIDASQLADYLN